MRCHFPTCKKTPREQKNPKTPNGLSPPTAGRSAAGLAGSGSWCFCLILPAAGAWELCPVGVQQLFQEKGRPQDAMLAGKDLPPALSGVPRVRARSRGPGRAVVGAGHGGLRWSQQSPPPPAAPTPLEGAQEQTHGASGSGQGAAPEGRVTAG